MPPDVSGSVSPVESRANNTCTFRPAEPDELGRAASLCTPAPARTGEGAQHCFVAVRLQPVERLMAVAFWKIIPETDGTSTAEFQWSALPALGAELASFIAALLAHISAEQPAVTTIAAAEWLPSTHSSAAFLRSHGFTATATRTYYQADAAAWRTALGENLSSPPTAAATDAGILPPQPAHFAALRTLLCHAALRPSELAHGFHTAASHQPSLFDPRCSGVMVENGAPTAACLAQHAHGHLTIAALLGTPSACQALLHHALQAHDHLPAPTTLSFHLDDRHPTAALAPLLESLPHRPATQLSRYTHTPLHGEIKTKHIELV